MKKNAVAGFCFLLLSLSIFSYTLLEQRDWLFDGDFILIEGHLALGKAIEVPPLTLYPVFLIHRLDYRLDPSDSSESVPYLSGMEMTPYALIALSGGELHIHLIPPLDEENQTEAVNYSELMALCETIRAELYLGTPSLDAPPNEFDLMMVNLFVMQLSHP